MKFKKKNKNMLFTQSFVIILMLTLLKTPMVTHMHNYVEPLLKSISLKESKDIPSVAEQFGLSKDEFNQQIDLTRQYQTGNTSAIEGSA